MTTSLLNYGLCFLIFQTVTSVQIRIGMVVLFICFHLQVHVLNGSITPMGVTKFYITLSVLFCRGVTYGRTICNYYTNIYGQRNCDLINTYSLSNQCFLFSYIPYLKFQFAFVLIGKSCTYIKTV